jgi:choline transport protein
MHRGPFFMGQTVGMTVNIVSLAWLVFAIVFFSFPYQKPVTGMCCDFPWFSRLLLKTCANAHTVTNMNYTCVVVGGFLFIELAWWLIAGKKYSETVQRAKEEGTSETVVIGDGKCDD